MTPQEAQKVLSAYRPGDPDALSKDVREALDLASALPELGAWWAREQAFDRAFGKKLSSVEPPVELKTAIVRGGATIIMAQKLIDDSAIEDTNGNRTEAKTKTDKIVPFSADDPLAEKTDGLKSSGSRSIWSQRRWAFSVAATALVGIFAATLFIKPQKLAGDDIPSLAQDMSYLVAGGVPPQWPSQNLDEVNTYLTKNHSPAPASLPTRTGAAKPLGGSVEIWHNHPITHLYLQTQKSIVHLFIVEHSEFPEESTSPEPKVSRQDAFTVTVWSENGRIYLMLNTE